MNQLVERVLQCVDFLTGRVHPADHEIDGAMLFAYEHVVALKDFRRRMRDEIPGYPDAFDCVDAVLRAIYADHGGKNPYKLLNYWGQKRRRYSDRQIFATPEQKQVMVEIWERWKDEERLKNRFEPVYRVMGRRDLTAEEILEVTTCLKDWITRRDAGQVY